MANVSYSRVNWEDSPSTNTPVNADNLNKMDKGVSDCAVAVNNISNELSDFSFRNNNGQAQYSTDGGVTWVDFKHPTGTKSITANGTYDVTDYASAIVNVTAAKQYVTIQGSERNRTLTLNHDTSTIFFISSWVYNSYVMTIAVNGVQKTPSLIIDSNSTNYGLHAYYISGSFKTGDVITLNSTQSDNNMATIAIC